MFEGAEEELPPRTEETFSAFAPDAVQMCSGPCGEVKLCTSFPTVSGKPSLRYGECHGCRDGRLRTKGAQGIAGESRTTSDWVVTLESARISGEFSRPDEFVSFAGSLVNFADVSATIRDAVILVCLRTGLSGRTIARLLGVSQPSVVRAPKNEAAQSELAKVATSPPDDSRLMPKGCGPTSNAGFVSTQAEGSSGTHRGNAEGLDPGRFPVGKLSEISSPSRTAGEWVGILEMARVRGDFAKSEEFVSFAGSLVNFADVSATVRDAVILVCMRTGLSGRKVALLLGVPQSTVVRAANNEAAQSSLKSMGSASPGGLTPERRRTQLQPGSDPHVLGYPIEGTGRNVLPAGRAKATTRWDQRSAIADAVLAVMVDRGRQVTSFNQVHEGVSERVTFVPPEADVRTSLRNLCKSDERCVKLSRDAFAWVLPGEAVPPPPAPPHVVEMIEHRSRGLTLDEIGAEYGVTRERVRQLLKKYGGPSADQIRALRAAEARSAQRAHEEAVAGAIRQTLAGGGPMTVAEMAEATGWDGGDVSRHWPQDLGHLRLWGAGKSESRWSDEDICEALRQASAYEYPLTTSAYSELLLVGQIDGPSVPRIGQRFGSWSAACAAAGVVAGDAWNREYESKWSDEDLLQVARAYLLDPNVPSSAHRFDEWKRESAPDGPSAQTLRNRFGSWTEVKRRALAQGGAARE